MMQSLKGSRAKSPISECEQHGVWLGRGLQIDYVSERTTWAIEWPRNVAPHMIWLEDSRALLFCDHKGERVGKGESLLFRQWHQRAPRNEFSLELKSAKWFRVGRVVAVDYWSNKWGRSQEYTHDVEPTSWLYSATNGCLVVKGDLGVSTRGLIG